eukprot:scaffold24983_cov107-Isochrysis_galbana.AAC.7
MLDEEVHEVQAEAEKLQKGWGQGVFGQAYQMLRKERAEQEREAQEKKSASVLTIEFTQESGRVVTIEAEGRNVLQQTQMALRKESASEEVAFKSGVKATIVIGVGDDARSYKCEADELVLDKDQEKQWKQLGQDANGLRLQLKFFRSTHTLKTAFTLGDIRATVPPPESSAAAAPAPSSS